MSLKSRRTVRIALLSALGALLVTGAVVMLVAELQAANEGKNLQSAAEPVPDYVGYDLNHPWFDKHHQDWYLDMFNQASIKPQEEGTIQVFPVNSVPRTGVEPFIPADAMMGGKLARDVMPKNPVQATPESIADGKFIFETYCGVCHGNNGMAGTKVDLKGMPAPPIAPLLPILTEAHIYNKALYGGPLMPSYGFQTTAKERWDAVNYMKSAQFGK